MSYQTVRFQEVKRRVEADAWAAEPVQHDACREKAATKDGAA